MNLATVKKILKEFDEKSSDLAKTLGSSKVRILGSMFYSMLRYGARPIDYERFEFHRKSNYERNRYMTILRYFKIAKKIDWATFRDISGNKSRELEIFKDFIHREWMVIDADTSEVSIHEFVQSHAALIAKPVHGEQGHGIFMIKNAEDQDRLIAESKSVPFILEEVIENAEYIKRINPSSLNTIRATTFIDGKGNLHIVSIILRVGIPGSHVDNWGSGGIGYNFDLESGVCNMPGKDKKNRSYIFHPGSNEKMVGFELNDFTCLRDYITKLAFILPSARYVGWDIAVTPSGFELIEMNCPAGHDMFQSFDNPVYQFFKHNW